MATQTICDYCKKPVDSVKGVTEGKCLIIVSFPYGSVEITANVATETIDGGYSNPINRKPDICIECLKKMIEGKNPKDL